MNIFLVGPMGSGKSSLGKKLAKSLDKKFIDTDKEIEKNERKTISEIFENSGESYFREKEREFLINIPNSLNMVIATGGGIVTDQENREKLKENKVIFLNASVERQHKRTSRSDKRPLLKNVDKLKKLRSKETISLTLPLTPISAVNPFSSDIFGFMLNAGLIMLISAKVTDL